jgi:hypothetical protein
MLRNRLIFGPRTIAVGTELQVKGEYDEQSGALKAAEVKVFLRETRKVRREALVDAKTTLDSTGSGWKGVIRADGQRIRVDQATEVTVLQNKSERKDAKAARKRHDEDLAPEDLERSTPFRGGEIDPNFFITYEGYRQRDGTILAKKVVLRRGEVEPGEGRMWRSISPRVKASNYVSGNPGELVIRGIAKYKLLLNEEAQAYVRTFGPSLIPMFQRTLPAGDPSKIPFQFYVSNDRRNAFNAFALPNGTVVIDSTMFNTLENEAQLAAVVSHEIAHATEKHQWRQHEFQKKKRIAIEVGAVVAAAYGKYNLSNMLRMIDGAIRNGYQRYLENQADRVGMEYMTEAGYDPRQAPRVWKVMTQKMGDHRTDFFWSNHDNNTTRRSYLMAELKNNYSEIKFDGLKTDSEEFQKLKALVSAGGATKKTAKVRLHLARAASEQTATQVTAPPEPGPVTQVSSQAPPSPTAAASVNGLVNVTLTSNPAGALVSFSRLAVCYTPCVTKLQPQRYKVAMKLAGYAEWTGEITVEAGKPLTVAADLQRQTEP